MSLLLCLKVPFCYSPQNSYVENLTPTDGDIKRQGPWELTPSWGWSLCEHDYSILIIKSFSKILSPSKCEDKEKMVSSMNPKPDAESVDTFIINFPPSRLWEISAYSPSTLLFYSSSPNRQKTYSKRSKY